MLLSNVFVFYQVMYVWTYCGDPFINIKRFEKRLGLLLKNVTYFDPGKSL